MQDLKELYQEVILDHNRNPRNFRAMEHASCEARGHNPLCGDRLKLFLKIKNDVIEDISFEGQGCAISQASASIMTEVLNGLSCEEARALFDKVHQLLTVEQFDIQSLPFFKATSSCWGSSLSCSSQMCIPCMAYFNCCFKKSN